MYKEIFGERLKKARIEAGYTQTQIYDITGIKPNTLSRYETGTREPDIETIGTLAEFYEISVDWLMGIGTKKTKE